VAPQARILSIRVITDKLDPGYPAYERQPVSTGQEELARAIRFAVRHHVGVISMSLGYGAPSRPVRLALQSAFAHNIVVVASSGNSGNVREAAGRGSAPYSFPADYPGVIGVAAVGRDFQPASFSSDNLSVEVAAPGVNVPAEGRDGQYWQVSGTSPACALTAGVAALIRSRYPGLPAARVRDAIMGSTWHIPPGGYDRQVGFGTVDAAAALRAAGQFAGQGRGGRTEAAGSSHFGGLGTAPPPPIAPRGPLAILLYSVLGIACLLLIWVAASRLISLRPMSRRGLRLASDDLAGAGPPGRGATYDSAGHGSRESGHRPQDSSGPAPSQWPAQLYRQAQPPESPEPPRSAHRPGESQSYGTAQSYGPAQSHGAAQPYGAEQSPAWEGPGESYGSRGSFGPAEPNGPVESYGPPEAYGSAESYGSE